jgi:dTDP-4-amino-4,6-dideoxygalactose transaminase
LDGIEGLVVPRELPGRSHVWHQYTVRVTSAARMKRDQLVEALTAAGIGNGIYYPKVVFDYPCYLDDPRVKVSDVPVARRIAQEVVSLPVHPRLTAAQVDRVAETVRGLLT